MVRVTLYLCNRITMLLHTTYHKTKFNRTNSKFMINHMKGEHVAEILQIVTDCLMNKQNLASIQ